MEPVKSQSEVQAKLKKKKDSPVQTVKRRKTNSESKKNNAKTTIHPTKGKCSTRKTRVFREFNLERLLFRWYERRLAVNDPSTSVSSNVLKKACALAKKMGASEVFLKTITEDWVKIWSEKYGINKEDPVSYTEHVAEVKAEMFEDDLKNVHSGEYTDDQIYCAFSFQFDLTSLPDKSLEPKSEDRVWLLMAGNKSGRHRTRLLITGKQWRPDCLKTVNMLSQPVIYAGGGVGTLTPDLFTWWFHREFAPAALALNESGAVLAVEQSDFLPPATDCIAADGKVKLVIYDGNVLEPKPDQNLIVAELRTRYAMLLLHGISIDQQRFVSVSQFLSGFTLKDAFPMLHRAWLNIRPETFHRCWTKPLSTPIADETSLSFGDICSTPLQIEEDRMLLLELQWLAHDLCLEVTDQDLANWVRRTLTQPLLESFIKPEPVDEADTTSAPPTVPTPAEAAVYLDKVLSWMESEALDPNLLLVVRDIMTMAKQACLTRVF